MGGPPGRHLAAADRRRLDSDQRRALGDSGQSHEQRMRTNPPPVHQLLTKFRVYADRTPSLYYECWIWRTKRAMRKWVRAERPDSLARRGKFLAIVCGYSITRYSKGKPARMLPVLGRMHFWQGALRMGIICHESGHAALGWCRRMKIDPTQSSDGNYASDGEEKFCDALGNIARQIAVRANALSAARPPDRKRNSSTAARQRRNRGRPTSGRDRAPLRRHPRNAATIRRPAGGK